VGWQVTQAARLNSRHFLQKHLNSGFSGIVMVIDESDAFMHGAKLGDSTPKTARKKFVN
jgi:hypothetical protein